MFQKPFTNRNGIIYDSKDQEVRLWGVNYYAPFCHNYLNIQELGKDHKVCINEDISHLKKMGVDFMRMHIYDREISDKNGNIVENDQMEIFDYLVEQLEQNNIFLMLTPITWWNTPVNQVYHENYYAYWHIGSQQAFGFSNYYGKDALLWHPDAIDAQKRYLQQFFSRKNRISGRTLNDYNNLIAVEIINEPCYIWHGILDEDKSVIDRMERAVASRAKDREPLRQQWQVFKDNHSNSDRLFEEFQATLIADYIATMFDSIDSVLNKPYLKTHINYSIHHVPEIKTALTESSLDALTVGCYLNGPNGFDSSSVSHLNYLEIINDKYTSTALADYDYGKLAKIIYEFDASGTLKGYPFAAMGHLFGLMGAQMAAYFTYTPAAVSEYNPGWLVHYINYLHTPEKAAAFTAAGEIFRNTKRGDKVPQNTDSWQLKNSEISAEKDSVFYHDEKQLIHSNDISDMSLTTCPDKIVGINSSQFVSYSGNGIYILEKIDDHNLSLDIMPDQKFVNDPLRGRSYRPMANRYMNVNQVNAVSRLQESTHDFTLNYPGFEQFSCEYRKNGQQVPVNNKTFPAKPGKYLITKELHYDKRH